MSSRGYVRLISSSSFSLPAASWLTTYRRGVQGANGIERAYHTSAPSLKEAVSMRSGSSVSSTLGICLESHLPSPGGT
jgi:hypothetical protein